MEQVPHLERCFITGIWQERMLDISKTGRQSAQGQAAAASRQATKPPSQQSSQQSSRQSNQQSKQEQPTGLPGHAPDSPVTATATATTATAQRSHQTPVSMFISQRFRHFAQMLWTVARVDTVIKNYVLSWMEGTGIHMDMETRCETPRYSLTLCYDQRL